MNSAGEEGNDFGEAGLLRFNRLAEPGNMVSRR